MRFTGSPSGGRYLAGKIMKTSDFDYFLPQELIAQTPVEPRDQSRLMVLDRSDGSLEHHRFSEIGDYLRHGDVLVFNDSRVIPARLWGRKSEGGGKLEILLLRRLEPGVWQVLLRPGKRVKIGNRIDLMANPQTDNKLDSRIQAEVIGLEKDGIKLIRLSDETMLSDLGQTPLPPYIHAPLSDPERYQTVYAKIPGSVAAPTAGLHFTPELIKHIENKGVTCQFVTLHVGLDTFRPIREDNPLQHTMYQEHGVLSPEAAGQLSRAKAEGRRVICVGTTAVRLVEAVAQASDPFHLEPFSGAISLFILPGYRFRIVDALITNFHLPRSTLLMLISAFAGSNLVKEAYQEAIRHKYRFYSFGDGMLIL
jgi:S-adenosylmethionine:tRNA ribosyltransferase-isomerase